MIEDDAAEYCPEEGAAMKIPVILATNENYAGPTATTIKSIILNRNLNDEYVFHILHTDLCEDIQNLYRSMNETNVSITCVDISKYIEKVKDLKCRYLTRETLYRLFIPEIFPMYDKVIYIDGDTIVLSDIAELYTTDVAGFVFAAAMDGPSQLSVTHYGAFMDSTPDENFCAGVLVMNIQEFDSSIKDKCIELLLEDSKLENRKMIYMDQDALNITCYNRVKKLDITWNYQVSLVCSDPEYDFILKEYRSVFIEARDKVKILHFSGEIKPWLFPGSPYSDVFWKYANLTPFKKKIHEKRIAQQQCLKEMFPYWNIELNSKVAIYGAGNKGKSLNYDLKNTAFADVVVWVDKNPADKGEDVKAVEEMKHVNFDRVIIAIENETYAKQAYETLVAMGISEEKIRWEFERKAPWR